MNVRPKSLGPRTCGLQRKYRKPAGASRLLLQLACTWLLFCHLLLFGNELPQYAVRKWQTEDGLPHNWVYSVVQTGDGFLWVGTEHGLARFDGVKFTSIDLDRDGSLKKLPIRYLLETKDAALWVGRDKGAIPVFNAGLSNAPPLIPDVVVKVLFESKDRSLWIGTTNGLARYRDGKVTWLTKADGLSDNMVLALCEDRAGGLWIGTGAGLVCYRDGVVTAFNEKEKLPPGAIRVLFCDRENNLWVGGSSGLIRIKDAAISIFQKNEGIPDNVVRSIFEDSRGQLWVGTMSGLCRRLSDKFVVESNAEGGSYETVFCMFEDREGSLWLGTKEGLSQLQFRAFKSYTRRNGLAHNNVMSVREDREGTIWAASWGGGVSRLRNGEFITYNYSNSRLSDALLSIGESADGSLWLGGDFDAGLFQWNDEAFSHYGRNEGLIDSAVRVIYEDRQGDLWIGTSAALYRKRHGAFDRFTTADGLAGNIIRAIREDREGNLWIGSSEGISLLSNEKLGAPSANRPKFISYGVKDGLPPGAVLSMHFDDQGNHWIGTDPGGLGRMTDQRASKLAPHQWRYHRYTTREGLFTDSILEILEDEEGYLWMSSYVGIFRVQKADFDRFDRNEIPTIPCASYGKADGMSSVQCNGVSKPAGWKSRDGRLWFPTTRGLVVVDPNTIRVNNTPPPVIIEEIISDKKQAGVSNDPESKALRIGPGRGELEFHSTVLSFRSPARNRFKYKLEGADPDWVDAGTRRVAYYNNLSPGRYRFTVKGCNSDGIWNETGASVVVLLQPHFWQTKWFIGFMSVFAIGFVASVARYAMWKKVQGKLLHLEQQHAVERERTRIAQDMHDELGVRLTEIILLADRVGTSPKDKTKRDSSAAISEAAREMSVNLKAIVWAVSPGNDSLDRVAPYIGDYVVKYLSRSGIPCRLDVPDELPKCIVSSAARHNLFLAVKEAVNNIAKYAEATEVWLRLKFNNSTLIVSIEDNGKGFSREAVSAFANGLVNMEKRMEKIEGRFDLTSKPGKGTRIRLEIPVRGITSNY